MVSNLKVWHYVAGGNVLSGYVRAATFEQALAKAKRVVAKCVRTGEIYRKDSKITSVSLNCELDA